MLVLLLQVPRAIQNKRSRSNSFSAGPDAETQGGSAELNATVQDAPMDQPQQEESVVGTEDCEQPAASVAPALAPHSEHAAGRLHFIFPRRHTRNCFPMPFLDLFPQPSITSSMHAGLGPERGLTPALHAIGHNPLLIGFPSQPPLWCYCGPPYYPYLIIT